VKILSGRSIYPGTALGPTRLITPHDLLDLHNPAHDAESDRELKALFRSPAFRVHTLSELSGAGAAREERTEIMDVTFWSAVNELLENRGGGIVFAVASVISRYLRSAVFSLDPASQEEYRCLSELGKSVLAGLLKFRKDKDPASRSYIVLAPTLSLSEAVSLEPRIIGFAVGSSIDLKLRVIAELLEVPAIAGLDRLDALAREFPFAKVDGARGTLESVPESDLPSSG
jgi:phosphoenolpyruvate-protein kinase (PTS system EI component)